MLKRKRIVDCVVTARMINPRVIVIAEMSKFINVPEVTIARQQGCTCVSTTYEVTKLYICR